MPHLGQVETDSHLGWAVRVALMYLPGGQWTFLAAVQESVSVVLFDVVALKNPIGHDSHLGLRFAEPATFMWEPGGHFLCAVQALGSEVLGDPFILRNPGAHASHLGCAEPVALTYSPAGH